VILQLVLAAHVSWQSSAFEQSRVQEPPLHVVLQSMSSAHVSAQDFASVHV